MLVLLEGFRCKGMICIEHCFIDSFGEPRPGKDQARIDDNAVGSRLTQLKCINRFVNSACDHRNLVTISGSYLGHRGQYSVKCLLTDSPTPCTVHDTTFHHDSAASSCDGLADDELKLYGIQVCSNREPDRARMLRVRGALQDLLNMLHPVTRRPVSQQRLIGCGKNESVHQWSQLFHHFAAIARCCIAGRIRCDSQPGQVLGSVRFI